MNPLRLRGLFAGAWRHTTRTHPHIYSSANATGRAPHVRMDVDLLRRQRTLLAALLPCAAAGVVVNGHHVLSAATTAGEPVDGWRGDVLRMGVAQDAGDITACVAVGLLYLLPLLTVAAAAAYSTTAAFARARRRDVVPGTAATVLVFTLLLPAGVPLWQAALGMACGIVLGSEVFGGPGRTFVHPAVVGLVVLRLSCPAAFRAGDGGVMAGHATATGLADAAAGGADALRAAGLTWWDTFTGLDPGALGDASALACVLGAALLLHRRAASWRVMTGALVGVAVAAALLGDGPSFRGVPWTWHITLGSLAFVVVFVATDPASSAFTNPGRWMHGALVGFLAVAIRVASPAQVEGALFAALLGSVLSPLVDHGVVRLHVLRRRRRA